MTTIDQMVAEVFEIEGKRRDLLVYPKPAKIMTTYKNDIKVRKGELLVELTQALKNESPKKAGEIRERLENELGIYLP